MKTSSVYYQSLTGNTKRVAEAVAEALGCSASPVSKASIDAKADLAFVGSAVYAIYGHSVHPAVREFADRLARSGFKGEVAVFGTGFPQSDARGILRGIFKDRGIRVADEDFFCDGRFIFFMRGHPDGQDLVAAKAFARKVAE